MGCWFVLPHRLLCCSLQASRAVARGLEGGRLSSPGVAYGTDRWGLFHLDEDFSESNDLAAARKAMN
jgi:hypothetical protein